MCNAGIEDCATMCLRNLNRNNTDTGFKNKRLMPLRLLAYSRMCLLTSVIRFQDNVRLLRTKLCQVFAVFICQEKHKHRQRRRRDGVVISCAAGRNPCSFRAICRRIFDARISVRRSLRSWRLPSMRHNGNTHNDTLKMFTAHCHASSACASLHLPPRNHR